MSIVSLPRRSHTPPPRRVLTPVESPSAPVRRSARRTLVDVIRHANVFLKAALVLLLALGVVVGAQLLVTSRQVGIENLQSQLLQYESTYASQVSTVTNISDPYVVESHASSMHLVSPTSITQIPSVSLARPLGLPVFTSGVTITPRL